jgi:hypothetical protein
MIVSLMCVERYPPHTQQLLQWMNSSFAPALQLALEGQCDCSKQR